MEGTNGYTLSDIAAVNGNNRDGMFGDGGWWIILLFILIVAGGGWGNGWNGGGNQGAADNYVLASDFAQVDRKIEGVYAGICDSTFALNNTATNGFASVQNTLTQGFAGLNTGMIQQSNDTRIAVSNIGTQLAQCCCDIKGLIADTNYNLATQSNAIQRQTERGFCDLGYSLQNNTRDIMNNAHADTDRVIAKLDAMEATRQAERIAALQAENQGLRFAASQNAQNAFIIQNQQAQTDAIINRLAPCPVPAYTVPNPNCCGCNQNTCC